MRPETKIQRAMLKHIRALGFEAVHVPNGAVLAGNPKRKAIQMNALKADGLMVGFPDLLIYGPNGKHGLIEVKAEGGKQQASQQAVEAWLSGWGHHYAVCRSDDDVTEAMTEWGWLAKAV